MIGTASGMLGPRGERVGQRGRGQELHQSPSRSTMTSISP